MSPTLPVKFKPYTRQTISQAPQWAHLSQDLRDAILVVSRVLPFRTNEYVMNELIDWTNIPDDPIYRLVFPHRDMLTTEEYALLSDLVLVKQDEVAIEREVHRIRMRMNPHPAGQMTHNVPMLNGVPVRGLQHKYKQTVLFFPSAG
jgi:L-lysine 2,3-aminomutase